MLQTENNNIVLCGEVLDDAVFDHEVFGEKFYSFTLKVKRLSGEFDYLPIMISERLNGDIYSGKRVRVEGQLRSYNIIADNKSRLHLRTFAREVLEPDESDKNSISLDGFICKSPIYRVTPFEREIADILLAVNRAYGKSDYIPTICWGRNARFCQGLEVGQGISVEGRLQSRDYQKKLDSGETITRTAYEVSVSKMAVKE